MEYLSQVPYDWETRKKYLDLPFPISEYQSRLSRIRSLMAKNDLDSLIIFGDSRDPGDLIYLSDRKYLDLPFPISEYQSRLSRIRSLMAKNDLDSLIIFGDSRDPGDLIYL